MAMNLNEVTDTITPTTGTLNITGGLSFTGSFNPPVVSVSNGLFVNNMTVGSNYSIPSGYSASSVGPVSVSSGVTVTIPSGSRWLVL